VNIKVEHLIILALIAFILFRSTENEEKLRWTDYRGHDYEVKINRHVH